MIQRISLQFLEFLTKFLTTLLSVVAIVVASQPAFSQSYDNLSSPSITCKTGDYQTECPYVDTNSVSQTADTQTKSLAIPNRLLENDFNMFVNPGQLVNYGTAYLEGWGGSNNVWGGATIPLPNNQKLGVFLRRPTNALSPVGSIRTLFNQYTFDGTSPSRKTNTTSNQGDFTGETFGVLNNTVKSFGNIDLLYALPLGNMNLGFRLGYGHTAASSDNDTTKIETSTRTDDISFGAGSQIKNIAGGYIDLTLNLGTTISSYHYKDKTVGSKEAVDVTTGFPVSIGFLGRFVKPDGDLMHIIAVNIDYYNVPWELGGNNKAGDSTHKLEAGADYINTSLDYALHQKMNDGKLKIIYSAGIGYSVEGYSFKTTTAPVGATTDVFGNEKFDENIKSFSAFYIPLGVAAEHQTWDTIKTRIGVRKNVFSTKSSEVKAASLTTKVNGQFWGGDELTLAMGLGWRPAEKVQFDLVANADAFNLTTFFTAISARYHY